MAFITRINRKGAVKFKSIKKQLQQLLGEVLINELKADKINETLEKSTPATRLIFLSEPTNSYSIISELELMANAKEFNRIKSL